MQFYRSVAVLIVFLSHVGTARAQVITLQTVGDKTVMCMHSGLTSDLKDCGARSNWYSYDCVGSISAIIPIENDEKEIGIIPEEIFHGGPAAPLNVLTSQSECLPKLQVGDRWLFFLRKEKDKPIVLDYYANDSRPVADAQEQIETLRRLENIADLAIVRGRVMQDRAFEGKAVPGAHVIAHAESGDLQFVSTTGADGRYEFQPLPPGKYKITVDPIGSLQPDASSIVVAGGTCWDLTLSRSSHAQLGGHVHRRDGSSVPDVDVVLMSADDSWFATSHTDARGYFAFNSLEPGEYVVGINLPGAPAWKYGGGAGVDPPTASLYYGDTPARASALVIKLAAEESRDDLDFVVPTQ